MIPTKTLRALKEEGINAPGLRPGDIVVIRRRRNVKKRMPRDMAYKVLEVKHFRYTKPGVSDTDMIELAQYSPTPDKIEVKARRGDGSIETRTWTDREGIENIPFVVLREEATKE
jgi:hypothetical protein